MSGFNMKAGYFSGIDGKINEGNTKFRIKRFLDIIGAIAGILIFSPVFLLVFLCLVLSNRGQIIFSQVRVGKNNQLFRCFKFRTMINNADTVLETILQTDPKAAQEWRENQKLTNDPRITKLGNFLRRTSLDELPQFFNVLIGDMSLVGPRPIVPDERIRYGNHYSSYLAVKPGLTGSWQVSGRNDTTYARRVQMDVDYAQNWSLINDVKIIVMTIPAIVKGTGK